LARSALLGPSEVLLDIHSKYTSNLPAILRPYQC
jgi:hypothetical protein